MPNASITTKCCVAGGGPAGMMLGFLLARAGVDVVVLEKHADFLRDFRGDTIHPSTLELMYELGLLDDFFKLPHQKLDHLTAQIGNERVRMVDLTHLPTRCKYIALMPQWDFLNFLADRGKHYPAFDLRMRAEATDLIEDGGRVVGLRARTPDGELEIRADLVVGADGRHSTVREKAGFKSDDYGAPMDVLWFRLPREETDETETFGHVEAGVMMIMLNRGDYWQCAFVIPKGGIDRLKADGLDAFRKRVVSMSSFLADRVAGLGKLGRHQASDCHHRSVAAMVAAGADLHRRCGARHVADRRRRHQPCHSGWRRGRKPARRAPESRQGGR